MGSDREGRVTLEKPRDSRDAVSPVVGALIMVMVAVALSAIVTVLFLGFGSETEDNVRATLNVRYDSATQGVTVTLMDRRDADYVEVRYIREGAGDALYAGLMAPGARATAQTGNATLVTRGETRVQDPDTVAATAAGSNGSNGSNGGVAGGGPGGAPGRASGEPAFDRALREGDRVRVMAIAHRGDNSSVLLNREFTLD